MEKDYFDAKFDGIEKLMASQESNLKDYIGAVSANVSKVRDDLQVHKESSEAHGAGAARSNASSIAGWLAIGISVVVGLVDFLRGKHG